jgi:hypothetical protein
MPNGSAWEQKISGHKGWRPYFLAAQIAAIILVCSFPANGQVALTVAGTNFSLISTIVGTNYFQVQCNCTNAITNGSVIIGLCDYQETNVIATGSLSLAPQAGLQTLQVPVNVPQLGLYDVLVSVIQNNSTLAVATTAFSVVFPRTAVGSADFGVCIHFGNDPSTPLSELDLVKLAGFSRVRDNFWWNGIEANPGIFTFATTTDNFVNKANSIGLSVMAILGYQTPAYPFPGGLPTITNSLAFGRYGAACINHYPTINDWEIINECTDYNPAYSYAQYTMILTNAWAAMHAANPSVNVISGGGASVDHDGSPLGSWESGLEGAGANNFRDSFSCHPYMSPFSPEYGFTVTGAPEPNVSIPTIFAYNTPLADQHPNATTGKSPKVMFTEFGYDTYVAVTEEMEAAYLARTYLMARRSGMSSNSTVNSLYWYDFRDDAQEGGTDTNYQNYFGIVRHDLSPKAAFQAAAVLTWSLGDRAWTQGLIETTNNRVEQYGTDMFASWSVETNSQAVTFNLPSGPYTLRDWQGRDTAVNVSGGSITLTNGPLPQYLLFNGAASVPSNMVALAVSNNQVDLTWTPSFGAESYNVKRSTLSGGPFTTIACGVGSTVSRGVAIGSYIDNNVTSSITYYYTVSAVNSLGESANSSEVGVLLTSGSLANPWLTQDIGAVEVAGGANAYSSDSFVVAGAGADIWGTADAFRYVYQPLTGNGSIIAHIASQQDTASYAKAGLMMRQDLTAGSVYAMLAVTPANGAAFQYRYTSGASSASSSLGNILVPYWVKLSRSGNALSGYVSGNGLTWTQVGGSPTVSMSDPIFVGLEVCSHNVMFSSQVGFDTVYVSGPLAAAPSGVTASVLSSNWVNVSWTASPGATSYNVKRSFISGGPYTTIATGVMSTKHTDIGLTNGATCYYVVSAVNGSGESANSTESGVMVSSIAPTAIGLQVIGNALQFSWPSDHIGWRLLVQTNGSTGLTTNWFTWPFSSNFTTISIQPQSVGSMFFRLTYP